MVSNRRQDGRFALLVAVLGVFPDLRCQITQQLPAYDRSILRDGLLDPLLGWERTHDEYCLGGGLCRINAITLIRQENLAIAIASMCTLVLSSFSTTPIAAGSVSKISSSRSFLEFGQREAQHYHRAPYPCGLRLSHRWSQPHVAHGFPARFLTPLHWR